MTIARASVRQTDARWLVRTSIVMLAFVMVFAWPMPEAEAAPPEVGAHVEFVVGSEVAHEYEPEYPWGVGYASGMLSVDLGAFDDVYPAASWSVTEWYAGMEPHEFASGSISEPGLDLTMSVPVFLTDYDDDFGGGVFRIQEWVVEAENGAGEATTVIVDAPMLIVQEDGTNARHDAPVPGATIETKGRWRVSNWNGWLGGHTAWTNRKWAKLSLTMTVSEGQAIALVMPMAENRGEARIKLDGVKVAEIDTHVEGPRRHRIVMWQTGPLAAGEHTIQVINLGTEGHPRIDVDAFMIAG